MNLKEYVITENKAVVRNDSVVLSLSHKEVNKTQYKFYAAQRAYVATNFVRLVDKAMKLARELGDEELALALQSNYNDEMGIGPDGKSDDELNHRLWKVNYLRAIGIEADIKDFPLLDSTRAHVNAFLDMEKNGTVFSISGTLLSLENIIPLEYRAAVSSRDYLFPEIFCVNQSDSIYVKKNKEQARQYLDDHIIHDSRSHFPQLLSALEKYENNPAAMHEIHLGIDFVNRYRKHFYQGLGKAFTELDNAEMKYYTYGCHSEELELAM